LVVEVLCAGTVAFDTEAKLAVYARNGVREAWLVDPDAETVTIFSGTGSEWTRERSVLFGEAMPSDVVDIGAGNLVREVTEEVSVTEPRRYAHPLIANEPPVVARMGMSADEYFTLPATSQPQNLIDGLLYVSPPPSEVHEDTVTAIAAALRAHGREHGGYVIRSPFDCRLNDSTVIQPDVAYTAAGRVHLVGGYM